MNDDFTTAREEVAEDAADLWTHRQGYAMTGTEWGAFEQGHLAGTAWARDHLAAHDARVRRDAAREALDGVAHRFELELGHAASLNRGLDAQRAKLSLLATEKYRDTHYPEESP